MATATYNPETKWSTTLSRSCTASDTTLYVNTLPTETSGIAILDKDSSENYETVLYTGVAGAGTDADPYRLTGCVRGLARSGSSLAAGTGKAHGKVSIGCADSHYFVSLIKAHLDGVQIMPAVSTSSVLPITGNTQYDQRFVKDSQMWYYWTLPATSGSVSDWATLPLGSIANATETTLGKVELANLADHASMAQTGTSGGPLAVQPRYLLKTDSIYTPAKLESGNRTETVLATWQAVTDGAFTVTVDGGSPVEVGPMNFSTATTLTGTGSTSICGIMNTALAAAIPSNTPTFVRTVLTRNLIGAGVWAWTLSGSGTNEYYLRTAALGAPNLGNPSSVVINGISVIGPGGTLGSLAAARWGYGDNDGLGYSTIYVRLADGTDPDTKADTFVQIAHTAFRLSSVNTTSSSAVSLLSAPASGTDISGAGASNFLDMDAGSAAFVTAATASATGRENYIPIFGSDGKLAAAFIPTNTDDTKIAKAFIDAKGDLITGSAADTPAILTVGSNGKVLRALSTEATGLKWDDPFIPGTKGFSDFYTFQMGWTGATITGTGTANERYASISDSGTNRASTGLLRSFLMGTGSSATTALTELFVEFPFEFNGSNKIDGRVGFVSDVTDLSAVYAATTNDFVGFAREGDSLGGSADKLWAVTVTGGAITKTEIATGVGTNFGRLARIHYTPTNVKFYINNTLVATHTTNIPAITRSYIFGFGTVEVTADGGNHGWTVGAPVMSAKYNEIFSIT